MATSRGPSMIPEGDIIDDTIEPFAEGAWFAWRTRRPGMAFPDTRNGIWWSDDGSREISLAAGSDLHWHNQMDYETYAWTGAAEGYCEDVCCHDTMEQAQACALVFLTMGRYCTEVRESAPFEWFDELNDWRAKGSPIAGNLEADGPGDLTACP